LVNAFGHAGSPPPVAVVLTEEQLTANKGSGQNILIVLLLNPVHGWIILTFKMDGTGFGLGMNITSVEFTVKQQHFI
jgi:hypothetical protein